ncbi:ribonuclease H-like domain-containing protein [Tanacetum coccineum]
MVPKAVLIRSGLVSLTTTRPVNTAQPRTMNSARPMINVFNKAHSTVRRPINNKTTTKNSNFNQRVNTVKDKNVNTARPKSGSYLKCRPKAVLKAVKGNQWMLKAHDREHVYLTDFEEIDRGYVAFGGNPKGGKITDRDDYSRFSWVFFLATKDETSGILKSFIIVVENLIDQRVKVIRCDNGTEFKNKEMNQFYERKGIKREFSVTRTLQQNGVAERKKRTLIEAARTMLADSKLPTTFWAETVNTACYVQNKVLVTKPHNKTPYELFLGRRPALGFMRPFWCPVTILNTIDHLGKFDGKADEGFFIGYSINSKAFRVFNSKTRIVEENLHVQFSENTPNIAESGPDWLFDIDTLTKSMNYKPVIVGNQSNCNACTKACDDASKARMELVPSKDYILLPLWHVDPLLSQRTKGGDSSKDSECSDQEKEDNVNSTNNVHAASTNEVNVVGAKTSIKLPDDPNMPELEDIVYSDDYEDVGAEADINNLDTFMHVERIFKKRNKRQNQARNEKDKVKSKSKVNQYHISRLNTTTYSTFAMIGFDNTSLWSSSYCNSSGSIPQGTSTNELLVQLLGKLGFSTQTMAQPSGYSGINPPGHNNVHVTNPVAYHTMAHHPTTTGSYTFGLPGFHNGLTFIPTHPTIQPANSIAGPTCFSNPHMQVTNVHPTINVGRIYFAKQA